jgi:hypothetical protein
MRYALVRWKTTKPLFNVIPMKDFVKLNSEETYQLDNEYKVRFQDEKSKKIKNFPAQIKFIGKLI